MWFVERQPDLDPEGNGYEWAIRNAPHQNPAYSNSREHAARIVACVNACEGINPEAAPELLKVLTRIAKVTDIGAETITPVYFKALRKLASDAIAKAES